MKVSVPILSGPVMENAESTIQGNYFRSVVRLNRFNEGPNVFRQWCDTPSGILEVFRRGTNRKFKIILIGGRVPVCLQNSGLIDATIESSTELVDHLAKFEGEDGWKGGEFWPNENAPCPITLHAYSNGVMFVLDKRVPSFGEGISVGLCPFDSLPAPIEWSHD